ncbi:hypothetical protein [Phytomonospora endophytica]|uniref:Uncharacterized protein n=1 Tax=Phytomonospora endophytica TaxID=714109 RepID=A0A841FF44_9ACTN|nr:hypothetical protein [Phytomonospora endophytica]MBB6034195.1 hypothetical protein [Phytomonospora endophytica]GIG66587.1 hypothetical protein Pen01_28820 [Phytomonospora endophytica]
MTTRSPIHPGGRPALPVHDRVDDEDFAPLVDDGDPWEAFFAAEDTAPAAGDSLPLAA